MLLKTKLDKNSFAIVAYCVFYLIISSVNGVPYQLHTLVLYGICPIVFYQYGKDITQNSFYQRMKESGYIRYLRNLIKQYSLDNKIVFLGSLSANEMKIEYLNANVFVCPSSIENSPNSLGEAQILGVPCMASYVGGIPDMMIGNEENLYRFEEIDMLAQKICQIFENEYYSHSMCQVAADSHDRLINSQTLISIYNSIILSRK